MNKLSLRELGEGLSKRNFYSYGWLHTPHLLRPTRNKAQPCLNKNHKLRFAILAPAG